MGLYDDDDIAEMAEDANAEIMRLKAEVERAVEGAQALRREMEWWKQEHQFQAELTKQLMPYQERAVKAEKEADALKKTAAVLANNCADLRAALRTIRDATHTNAVTLRGMAALAVGGEK